MTDKFLDKEGLQIVADNTNLRVKIVTEVPSTSRNDMVILYNGTDTTDFKKGGIYKYNGTGWESFSGSVEQVYDSTSEKAQSGKAVDMAVQQFITDNTDVVWESKTWQGFTNFYNDDIWTDGDNIYCSNNFNHYVLNRETSTWETKTWNGLSRFYGGYIWYDSGNIYYSDTDKQYILNRETSTWEPKTWHGFTELCADKGYVWTDGIDMYYSAGSDQYVLNRVTDTWEPMTWNGIDVSIFQGINIWKNGTDIYFSTVASNQQYNYILDKSTHTWYPIIISSPVDIWGHHIWTDGNTSYHWWTDGAFIFNKTKLAWEKQTVNGITSYDTSGNIYACVWCDEKEDVLYYSGGNQDQYVGHRKFNTLIK